VCVSIRVCGCGLSYPEVLVTHSRVLEDNAGLTDCQIKINHVLEQFFVKMWALFQVMFVSLLGWPPNKAFWYFVYQHQSTYVRIGFHSKSQFCFRQCSVGCCCSRRLRPHPWESSGQGGRAYSCTHCQLKSRWREMNGTKTHSQSCKRVDTLGDCWPKNISIPVRYIRWRKIFSAIKILAFLQ